jgi:hypothetical protein
MYICIFVVGDENEASERDFRTFQREGAVLHAFYLKILNSQIPYNL